MKRRAISLQNVCSSERFAFQLSSSTIVDISTIIDTTVKILKIGTPEIITIIVLQLEQLDFTVQHCVQKMQTE